MEQSPTPVVSVKQRSSFTSGSLLLILAALVAVGGVTFAAGRLTAPAATPARAGGFGAGAGAGGGTGFGGNGAGGNGFGGRQGGGLFGAGGLTVQGTVTSIASDSIALTLANGSTIQIPIDSSTTFHRQAAAASTDVKAGSTVLVELTGRPGAPGPGASAAPNASPNPNPSGQPRLGPARDVTLVGQ